MNLLRWVIFFNKKVFCKLTVSRSIGKRTGCISVSCSSVALLSLPPTPKNAAVLSSPKTATENKYWYSLVLILHVGHAKVKENEVWNP